MEEVNDKALKRQRIIEENRHKELSSALKAIYNALKEDSDKEVVSAIKDNLKAIEGLVGAVKSMPPPEVKVDVSQKEIVTSLQAICDKIVASNQKVIEALNRPQVERCDVIRDGYGNTKSVNFVYKK